MHAVPLISDLKVCFFFFFKTYVPTGNGEVTGLFESTPPIGFVSTIEVTFMKYEDAPEMVVSGLKLRLCGVIGRICF